MLAASRSTVEQEMARSQPNATCSTQAPPSPAAPLTCITWVIGASSALALPQQVVSRSRATTTARQWGTRAIVARCLVAMRALFAVSEHERWELRAVSSRSDLARAARWTCAQQLFARVTRKSDTRVSACSCCGGCGARCACTTRAHRRPGSTTATSHQLWEAPTGLGQREGSSRRLLQAARLGDGRTRRAAHMWPVHTPFTGTGTRALRLQLP
jgi:hypothetical protein